MLDRGEPPRRRIWADVATRETRRRRELADSIAVWVSVAVDPECETDYALRQALRIGWEWKRSLELTTRMHDAQDAYDERVRVAREGARRGSVVQLVDEAYGFTDRPARDVLANAAPPEAFMAERFVGPDGGGRVMRSVAQIVQGLLAHQAEVTATQVGIAARGEGRRVDDSFVRAVMGAMVRIGRLRWLGGDRYARAAPLDGGVVNGAS